MLRSAATASIPWSTTSPTIAATFDRYRKSRSPSTRFKDLVDLVAIASAASVGAEAQISRPALGGRPPRDRAARCPRDSRPRGLEARL